VLDSIFIGMSGLMGYSRGLRVIANNTANINTPGFKGAALQFGDLFYASGPAGGTMSGAVVNQMGQGLTTYSTSLDFSQGELRQTGDDLDLAVDGQGLFMLRNAAGEIRYTRDGEFKFDESGSLVSRTSGATVMARDEQGALVPISLEGLRTSPAKATTTVSFRGNLSINSETPNLHTLTDVKVLDEVGGEHQLTLEFLEETPARWKVTAKDGASELATNTLNFVAGQVDTANTALTLSYQPEGLARMTLTLDFGEDVTSFPAGSVSTLAMVKQDGYASGSLTNASFDADGVLELTYSNAQIAKGVRLALGRFESTDAVRSDGDNLFEAVDPRRWEDGTAQSGAFGSIRSGVVEISNVDLSSEFSDLVIMQRGYQASSQVISTANEMLQQLFSLKGR
jgi:flagellar hook protein FlgE